MSTIIADGDKSPDYDILQLSSYKKIIAEDDKFIALKIWESTYNENKSIYRTFLKNVNYMISNYVIRSDNMTTGIDPDNHFIGSKSFNEIDVTMLSWLYNTTKKRGKKCLKIDISMMESKEVAQPIESRKVSNYIKNEIAKEII